MNVDDDIEHLVPQRDPILMVDRLASVDGDQATTSLAIKPGNIFLDSDGLLAEAGLIEHIAQSASAFAGYRALAAGAVEPPVGYIGEVKRFHCYRRPRAGELLHTTVVMGAEVAGVTLLTGQTRVGNELVADTRMKISIDKS